MAPSNTAPLTGADENSTKLKSELKEWERNFAATHEGRKAGREDIKQHPEIEQKYRIYNRLRTLPAQASAPHTSTPSKKRASTSDPSGPLDSARPKKRPRPSSQSQATAQIPKRTSSIHPAAVDDPYDAPVSTHVSPVTQRTSIGPTPQKDGQVLGLFDAFSPASNSKTPSKQNVLLSVAGNAQATPSKRPKSADEQCTGMTRKRSPTSASKSAPLDSTLTPSACCIIASSTPGSRGGVSKLRFDDTPAFLRRDSQRVHNTHDNEGGLEEGISWSPIAMRKIPKPVGRGLSALMRGLREMEEEKLDEELELMREMEGLDSQSAPSKKSRVPKILVGDSQRGDMPLGPDGGAGSESDDEEEMREHKGKGRDGKPLKVWKKKGQKRTTRRVVMKPSTGKWKPEPTWKGSRDDVDEEDDDVPETQVTGQVTTVEQKSGSDSEDYEEGIDGEGVADALDAESKNQRKGKEKEGLVAKVKKKISATAHANFRALKIKNKQSKAKGGRRFGRR